MATNIFAQPVKFLLRYKLLRHLDRQWSKKQLINSKKLKTYNHLRTIERRKFRTLLSFRTNLLSNHYKFIANPMTHVKYCAKCGQNTSPGRHKYHQETETAMNQQINAEFNAAFAYLSMACYFGRTEVSLKGCQGFFMNMHEEELSHATILINFQLMRGAHVVLSSINVPESQDWKCINKAFTVAVEMEKLIKDVCRSFQGFISKKMSAVFDIAEKHKDLQVMDLISTQFMEEQNQSICELARLLSKAKMTDNAVGEFLFDKFLYDSFVKRSEDNLMYKTKLDPKDEKIYK